MAGRASVAQLHQDHSRRASEWRMHHIKRSKWHSEAVGAPWQRKVRRMSVMTPAPFSSSSDCDGLCGRLFFLRPNRVSLDEFHVSQPSPA